MHLTNVLAIALAASTSALPVEQSLDEQMPSQLNQVVPDATELSQGSGPKGGAVERVGSGSGPKVQARTHISADVKDISSGENSITGRSNVVNPAQEKLMRPNGIDGFLAAQGGPVMNSDAVVPDVLTVSTGPRVIARSSGPMVGGDSACGNGGCPHSIEHEVVPDQELCGSGGCTHGGKTGLFQGEGPKGNGNNFIQEVSKLIGLAPGQTEEVQKVGPRSHFYFGQADQTSSGPGKVGPRSHFYFGQADQTGSGQGVGRGGVFTEGPRVLFEGPRGGVFAQGHFYPSQADQTGLIQPRGHFRAGENDQAPQGRVGPRSMTTDGTNTQLIQEGPRGQGFATTDNHGGYNFENGPHGPVAQFQGKPQQASSVWGQPQQEIEYLPGQLNSVVSSSGPGSQMVSGQGPKSPTEWTVSGPGQIQVRAEGPRIVEQAGRDRASTIYQVPEEQVFAGQQGQGNSFQQVKGQNQQGQF
ncbi:hypothetical protein OQA88_12672 [Cercophora sp. LCS_1]